MAISESLSDWVESDDRGNDDDDDDDDEHNDDDDEDDEMIVGINLIIKYMMTPFKSLTEQDPCWSVQ